MTTWKGCLSAIAGAVAAFSLSPVIANADLDEDRKQDFCRYMGMSGYSMDAEQCDWVSIAAQGQCIGLMEGRSAWDMMDTSRVMVGAKTQDAQWTMLKTSVNVYCPILDSTLPMSP